MHHIGYHQNNLGENNQKDGANNAGNQEIAGTFKNCGQVYFRSQCFDHKYIDSHRWCNRPHGGHHGNDDGKPDGVKAQRFSQRKKNRDGEHQKAQGVYKTTADQVNQ